MKNILGVGGGRGEKWEVGAEKMAEERRIF